MKSIAAGILALFAGFAPAHDHGEPPGVRFLPGTTVDFSFESNGHRLSGQFDTPATDQTRALILFVHGYGGTDIRARRTFADLRQRFNTIGIATAVWDKPGQGRSAGIFDINQPVASSAQEVLDAADHLRALDAPGADRIGLWGVSRAGWIVPIALSQDPDIEFWISVSGTTADDNFSYLLLSNLPYEGGSAEQAERLEEEWRTGCRILRNGGSFEHFQAATESLRANDYIREQRGEWPGRAEYQTLQRACSDGRCERLDDDLCSYIHVEKFRELLSSLDVDTLAIFGERDRNVDWRKTRRVYRETIGQNPNASLSLASFKDADHNLNVSTTGSIREMQTMTERRKSNGYYEVQIEWLEAFVLGAEPADVTQR